MAPANKNLWADYADPRILKYYGEVACMGTTNHDKEEKFIDVSQGNDCVITLSAGGDEFMADLTIDQAMDLITILAVAVADLKERNLCA